MSQDLLVSQTILAYWEPRPWYCVCPFRSLFPKKSLLFLCPILYVENIKNMLVFAKIHIGFIGWFVCTKLIDIRIRIDRNHPVCILVCRIGESVCYWLDSLVGIVPYLLYTSYKYWLTCCTTLQGVQNQNGTSKFDWSNLEPWKVKTIQPNFKSLKKTVFI